MARDTTDAAENIARVVTVWRQGTQERVQVHHVWHDDTWDESRLNAVATSYVNWWKTSYKFSSTNTMVLDHVTATRIDGAFSSTVPCTTGCAGDISGSNPEPGNVTGVVSERSVESSRRGRGRTYSVGLTDDQTNNDSTMTSAKIASLIGVFINLLTTINVGNRFWGILSRSSSLFFDIVSLLVDANLDSQRRRLPGRGT